MKNQKPRSNIKAPAEYHLFVQLGFPKKGVLGNRLLSGTLICGQLLFLIPPIFPYIFDHYIDKLGKRLMLSQHLRLHFSCGFLIAVRKQCKGTIFFSYNNKSTNKLC